MQRIISNGSIAPLKMVSSISTILRGRTVALKFERERAKSALDRARAQWGTVTTIDAEKIDAFARMVTDKLDTGDINARKGYIRSIVDMIEVDDKTVRIIGSKDILQAVIAGKQNANENVHGFVWKWRASQNKTTNSYVIDIVI